MLEYKDQVNTIYDQIKDLEDKVEMKIPTMEHEFKLLVT